MANHRDRFEVDSSGGWTKEEWKAFGLILLCFAAACIIIMAHP